MRGFHCFGRLAVLGGLTNARLMMGLMGATVLVNATFSSSIVRRLICLPSSAGLVESCVAASAFLVAVVVAGKMIVRWCGV